MRKIKLFLILSMVGLLLFSCSKKQEETKMIPSSAVKKSGTHSDLLTIKGDSVKVMLVKIDDDEWSLRAVIPIENATLSNNSSGTSSMGNMSAEFLDANGNSIDFELRPDWDVVESVLSSNSFKTEDLLVKEAYHGYEYKTVKEKFDKIAGIVLKEMKLTDGYGNFYSSDNSSSSGSSSYSGDDDDDWDDVDLDDAVTAAKAATEVLRATTDAVNSTKDMYKSAKKAEKQLKKMEEDDDWGW